MVRRASNTSCASCGEGVATKAPLLGRKFHHVLRREGGQRAAHVGAVAVEQIAQRLLSKLASGGQTLFRHGRQDRSDHRFLGNSDLGIRLIFFRKNVHGDI